MSALSSTEFNSLLGQVEGLFGQIDSSNGTSNGTSKTGKSYDEIAWLKNAITGTGEDVQNIASGNDSQKASGMQSLINKAMSLIDKLTSNEAASANKEVKNGNKKATQLEEQQKAAEEELKNNISNIETEIENQSDIVETAKETIETTKKKIEEKQKDINKIIEDIDKKQKELASATTPEEKAKLLNEIKGLSGQLTAITIEDEQTAIAEASSQVEAAVTNIETAKGNAVEIQADGQMKITQLAQQGTELVQENVQTNAKAITNNATGNAAQQSAEAASSNIISGSTVAAKLYRVAADQNAAGSTRTAGAVKNLQTVMQGIGGLQNNASLLKDFDTAIGKLKGFSEYVGSWNEALEPVITSIGSFDAMTESNEELQTAVTTDLGTLGYSVDNDGNVQKDSNENNTENESIKLKTPKVKVKVMKFGI